jgi:HlyD family secretion protein
LLAALLVGAGALVRWWTRPAPVTVVVRAVERGLVEATVVNTRAGTVMACRRARLAAQAGGRVERLPVERGDRVREGQLLLELWNEDLEAQAALAASELDGALARADELCLNAELAAREGVRFERLFSQGIATESDVDRARSTAESSAAGCRAARALVEEARAAVAVAREELSKTVLVAPFAGVVAEVNAELGEMVTPSPPGIPTPPAIDLIDEGCLYVEAPIDEVDAPHVRLDQPARVRLDAFPDRSFEGTVSRIAPYVLDLEKQARTVDVEVRLARPEEIPGLAPGYSADVEILLARQESALRVPTEAVVEGDRVLVLAGDRLVERTFEPGISNWEYTQVLAGLEPGTEVVVSLDREEVAAGARAVAERPPGR